MKLLVSNIDDSFFNDIVLHKTICMLLSHKQSQQAMKNLKRFYFVIYYWWTYDQND